MTVVAAFGSTACAADSESSRAAAASANATSMRAKADRVFAACLKRAGARAVRSRDDLRFLRGTSTEDEGDSAITNGLVSAGRGVVELEWMTVDERRWRVFSRSYEEETDSPNYEGIWQRVVRDSPDVAVLAVKRTGSPASFTAARRCIT